MGQGDRWLSERQLIEAVGHPRPTVRQLESWRLRGLLPRPVRCQGGRAVWRYPPGTTEQLRRLLHWRQGVRNLELIRVALWLEDFPMELGGVRKALDGLAARWASDVARERDALGNDPVAALNALGGQLAAMRSRAPIPRAVRMTSAERTRAYALGLAMVLGWGSEVDRRRSDVQHLERMLGLRSGQGGGLAAELGESSGGLIALPEPDVVRSALAGAHDLEYELARRIIGFVLLWGPPLSAQMAAEGGPKYEPFAALVEAMFKEAKPRMVAFMLVVLLTHIHASRPSKADLPELQAALDTGALDLAALELLPRQLRRSAFDRLPSRRRALVAAALQEGARANA